MTQPSDESTVKQKTAAKAPLIGQKGYGKSVFNSILETITPIIGEQIKKISKVAVTAAFAGLVSIAGLQGLSSTAGADATTNAQFSAVTAKIAAGHNKQVVAPSASQAEAKIIVFTIDRTTYSVASGDSALSDQVTAAMDAKGDALAKQIQAVKRMGIDQIVNGESKQKTETLNQAKADLEKAKSAFANSVNELGSMGFNTHDISVHAELAAQSAPAVLPSASPKSAGDSFVL